MPAILVTVLVIAVMIGSFIFVLAHPGIALLLVLFGVPAVIGVLYAIVKGLEKNTVVANTIHQIEPPRRPALPRLPDPRSVTEEAPAPAPDPFAGTQYVLPKPPPEPEPEPVYSIAPAADPCEGPSCTGTLPEDPWVCGTYETDQEHEFCSEKCMQQWIELEKVRFGAVSAQPPASFGQTLRRLW